MRPAKVSLSIFLAVALACSPARGADFLTAIFHPQVGRRDASVENLARGIDYLEHQIETFGTVVAQHPDVWGQARLTKHRDEFERTMLKELDQFKPTLQATVYRSDQSYLAMALTLSAAAQPSAKSVATVSAAAPPSTTPPANAAVGMTSDVTGSPINRSLTQPVISTYGVQSLAIEPTVYLDQMKRYLDHLHELRRINEGDDTADSPGYSLNLVRIPISVLPGKRTRKGFGAELTITAEPNITDDLLSVTWRNLVINDVADQLGLPIVSITSDETSIERLREVLPPRSGGKGPPLAPPLLRAGQYDFPAESYNYEINDNTVTIMNDIYDNVVYLEAASVERTQRRRLPYPASQVHDVFGTSGRVIGPIALTAYDSLRDQTGIRRRNLLDVQAFLQAELQAAFDFLSTENGQRLWEHCTPELATAVLTRQRYERAEEDGNEGRSIAALRHAYMNTIDNFFPRASYSATVQLMWAILVESALLNQRLIEDMQQTAIANDCQCMVGLGDWPDFYMPDPSPEARAAFNEYVRCRWPIHVFALDPVTDDQNVGDAFDRRRELQLAIAVAVAKGEISAQAAMKYVRSMETEIQTISLNRTAIGFSHGDDTFGWRFYPRVQTPPSKGNLQTFIETLAGGPSPDCDLRERQLEGGIRECVAIVMMPSFVPNVNFDVRSNWFSLTNPRKKLLTLQDTMALSRSYQAVRNAGYRVRHSRGYRPSDVSQLARVVNQLERRLPLQSMLVQIPFENTLGGFDMFQTGVTDLGPELTGWYGAPGVHVVPGSNPTSASTTSPCTDMTGTASGAKSSTPSATTPSNSTAAGGVAAPAGTAATSTGSSSSSAPARASVCPGVDMYGGNQCQGTCDGTTLFLVGNHFSVHDTQVIAGGRCVPFVLLSREYMRVTVPSNVLRVSNKKDPSIKYVDVHVATPYGVSGSILIPAVFDNAASSDTALGELLKTKRFALSKPTTLTIAFAYEADDGRMNNFALAGKKPSATISYSGSEQLLKLDTLPDKFEVSMVLRHGSDDMGPAVALGVDSSSFKEKGELVVKSDQILAAVVQILSSQSDVTNRYTNGAASAISFDGVFYVQVGDQPPHYPAKAPMPAIGPAAPTLPIRVEGTLPIQLQLRAARTSGAAPGASRPRRRPPTAAGVSRPRPKSAAQSQPGPALFDSNSGRAAKEEELPPPRRQRRVKAEAQQDGGWRPASRSAASLAVPTPRSQRQSPDSSEQMRGRVAAQ